MKTRNTLSIVAMAVMVFTGCQKEKAFDGIRLIAERLNSNQKVAVNGTAASWVDGESLYINGAEKTIDVDGSVATVTGVTEATHYYAVYPADIYSSNDGDSYTLNIPASYTYAKTGSLQSLATPMVAYSSGNELFFKHVTAAVNVEVKNYHDYAITIDQITVSSNSYKINGSVTVTLGDDITVAPQSTETASEKTVTMTFDGGTTLTIPAGQKTVVQIPLLPVGDGNKFTVSIQVSKTSPAVTATLTRTQITGGTLGRAELGNAMYTIGGPFSVSSTKKVIFSKGNLQYNAAATTWRFAENQYDYIGSGNANIAADYDGWIDLFGWGTGNNPTNTSTTASDYSSFNDWGTAAAGNIGSGWYTLSKDEWTYLTTGSRTTSTYGLPSNENCTKAKFVKASINNVSGLIIFPDYYTHPTGVSITQTTTYNGNYANFNQFTVNDGWKEMELAGAVFIPLTGYRNGVSVDQTTTYAYYWSSVKTSSTTAYSLCFYNSGLNAANSWTNADIYKGHSVRLVRDVD